MMYDAKTLCLALVDLNDGLRALYDEHIQDFDELLPHIFMADVTRHVLAQKVGSQTIVQKLEDDYDDLEEDARNVIQASFVENIESESELETALYGVVGERLRREWLRQHSGQ